MACQAIVDREQGEMAGRIGAKSAKGVKGKGREKAKDGAVIQDPRFARLHSDPRFQRMPKRKTKVVIDSRFQHMFSDKSFSDPHALDKRGRKTKKKDRHSLRRYYNVADDEEEPADVNCVEDGSPASEPEDIEVPTPQTPNGAAKLKKARQEQSKSKLSGKPARGETGNGDLNSPKENVSSPKARSKNVTSLTESSWKKDVTLQDSEDAASDDSSEEEQSDDSESSSESSSSDDESELEQEPHEDEEDKVPTTNEETRRLAMVNMDWQYIKAVDMLVLLRSFLPKGGEISSVAVYPSEFGLQQMKEEESQGPKGVFERDDDGDDDEDKVDMEKLRQYEKAKLRYYYAVVECDSIATASSLYASCDGMEFERTSNTLDLRFIPDQMEFKHPARDTASEVPGDYKAPEFETRALQHSTVKLTWDDDEPVRVKALHRNFTSDQLNELDFKEYLASESDEDAEEQDEDPGISGNDDSLAKRTLREKYRSLLLGDTTTEAEKEQEDMEITFHTGLDDLSQRLLEKKEERRKGEETVWESYLRKKKEKKKQRARDRSQANGSDDEDDANVVDAQRSREDSFFQHDENPFDDPFFASGDGKLPEDEIEGAPSRHASKKKGLKGRVDKTQKQDEISKKREEKEIARKEDERSKAELELLLMDDHGLQDGVKGYNVRKQKLKEKRKKKKRGQQEATEEDPKDKQSSVNLDDPRFSSLFTSHHFAIEPTDPNYKRSSTQLGIVAQKQRLRLHGPAPNENSAVSVPGADETSRKRKAEISSIVHSLKRKVGRSVGNSRQYQYER